MKAKILLEDPNLKLGKQENPSYSVVLDLYRRSCSNPNNDTADTEVGSFSVLARTDSMTSDSGERASILTDCPSSPSRRVMAKRRLTDFNAKFIEKENWKKGHYCEVCDRDVDKTGVGRHHCRICGNAVCGNCSSRRVNNRRVCDLCFYKTKREDEGQQLRRSLSRKDEISQEKGRYIKKLKGEFLNEREKVYQLEAQIEKEELIHSQAVENQTKTKFAFLNTFNKANEIRERLASGIEINKSLIDEKESKLRSLRTKIAALKVEVAQKSFKHRELTSHFENLMTKHTSLNEISESMYSSSSRNSVLEKHYSLHLDKSDGKYQISMKPAQI